MTLSAIVSLFFALLVLALLPGPGMLLVVAHTLRGGLRAGRAAVCGIVTGDLIYILLAFAGLAALVAHYPQTLVFIKFAGGAYLLLLALTLAFARERPEPKATSTSRGSFASGLLTTLANPKAMVFYASFLPAFVNLRAPRWQELFIVSLLAVATVGGVMFGCALAAARGRQRLGWASRRAINRIAAAALAVAGVFMWVA